MTIKVHGNYRGGEFLTGDLDFVTVYSTHALEATNVTQSLADFKAERFIPAATNISSLSDAERTVDGVVIADDAAWTQAYARQSNLNKVMAAIGTVAAPVVATNPTSATVAVDDGIAGTFAGSIVEAGNFGAALGSVTVYALTFAVEHTRAFVGAQGSKTVGNQNSATLDAVLAGLVNLMDDAGAAQAIEVVVPGAPSATATIATNVSNSALVAG